MNRSTGSGRDAETRLEILALEPWCTGSHERFLAHWCRRTRHSVRVIGLAARDWKWRMRSSSFELAQRIAHQSAIAPDVLFASDYVDLPALMGWLPAGWSDIPCIVYFHENQLTYPLRPGEESRERDLHFAFTNILSAVRSSRSVFNSGYHRDDFARASDELLARMPRPNPRAALRKKIAESAVIAPGADMDEIALGSGAEPGSPLRVLFNHRWEHDKDPLAFLAVVRELMRRKVDLELVLLGERFERFPEGASELLHEIAPIVLERGFVADRARYAASLGRADVVVSTARHEFFGISVAEAMAAGCMPLVPRRLAYPELVPPARHGVCLYEDTDDLLARLEHAASNPSVFREAHTRDEWRAAMKPYSAELSARRMDEVATAVALESERELEAEVETEIDAEVEAPSRSEPNTSSSGIV